LAEDIFIRGEPITLTPRLAEGSTPVTGALITTKIEDRAGKSKQIRLYDDGSHGDAQANDSLYANLLTEALEEGTYEEVTVTGRGWLNDKPFVRETTETIWVAPPRPLS
jgi:hypothetical protein